MNREDIIRMAREAGLLGKPSYINNLEAFAALVIANHPPQSYMTWQEGYEAGKQTERDACIDFVAMYGGPVDLEAAIRARGNVATNDTSQEHVDKTSESVHEPWSPVSIGVDITDEGAHVVGIYALDKDTSQVFYAKYYPVPQRTWIGLTDEEKASFWTADQMTQEEWQQLFAAIEAKLKEKNT